MQINTNELSQRKNVEIDGHHYIVRRMGAGDQLTINHFMRELEALVKKEKDGSFTAEDEKRVDEIERASIDISLRCFDDQGDGSKSRELVMGLSPDELKELMRLIFDEKPEVS